MTSYVKMLTVAILVCLFIVPAHAIYLEKEFIGVGADDNGLMTIGVPNDSCPSFIDLTCCNYCMGGGSGLSHVVFKIDDELYTNDVMLPDVADLDLLTRTTNILDLHLRTEWAAGDIRITQLLVPLDGDSTGSVRIQYSISNNGADTHSVGVLLNLDLKIGNSDSSDMARFRLTTGEVIDTTAILEAAEIPVFWDSFDPLDSTFTARATLGIPPNVRPDRIAIGQAHLLTATTWEPTFIDVGDPYEDSGILYWWYPRTLAPGEVTNVITTYGRGPGAPPADTLCNFLMNVAGTRNFGFYICELIPNPFSITLVPINSTLFTAESVFATIDFIDPLIELAEGETATKELSPSTIGAGLSGITYWIAEIVEPPMTGNVMAHYTITMTNIVDTCRDDTIECLIHDTCFYAGSLFIPTSTYEGPDAEIQEPLYGTITADRNQPIYFDISDAEGVNSRTIWVRHLMGEYDLYFRVDRDSIVVFEGDSLIIFYPNRCGDILSYSDGNRPIVQLLEAMDIHGCALGETLTTRFLVDLTAPVCRGYGERLDGVYYLEGDTLWDSLFVAWMNIYDNLGHVDTESIELGINKLSDRLGVYDIWHDAVYYFEDDIYVIFDTIFVDPASGGIHWDDGVQRICPISCTDNPDYGIPNAINDTAYCFSFTVNAHGPRAYSIEPNEGECTSDPMQPIIFKLIDGNGIIASTVEYSVQGETFGVSSTADTIFTWTPVEAWEHMEEVTVHIYQADDSMDVPIDPDHAPEYTFLVDLEPPYLGEYWPADGEMIGTVVPMFTIPIYEEGCGIDTTSFVLEVDGEIWPLSDPAVWWDGGILYFDMEETRLAFNIHDTIEVCVTVADDPTWGDPNVGGPYCWTFFVNAENPQAWFVTGTYLCDPAATVQMILTDENGIDGSTIDFSTLDYTTMVTTHYSTSDMELDYYADTLSFTFSTPITSGDSVLACIEYAEDLYGFMLEGPVCETYYFDLDAPYVTDRYTVPTEIIPGSINDSTAEIYIDLGDSVGYIDESTILFQVNGVDYTLDSDGLFFEGGHMIRFDPEFVGLEYALYETLHCVLYVGSYCDVGSNMIDPPYAFSFWVVSSDITEKPSTPLSFDVFQNYPNPFNSLTTIVFSLAENEQVNLEVFDITGRRTKTLIDSYRKAGIHVIRWDGTDADGDPAPSGLYFYKLTAGDNSAMKKMWLIR
ncbi:T9SS type A sorting domain-containing protein [bacterium]|nr:T9SS type A sorting domain-containing protein [bacterium]